MWTHTNICAGLLLPCRYLDSVAANRFGTGVGVWFVGNMLTNQLISTGAFEVYYDGRLVSWSCCVSVVSNGSTAAMGTASALS